jgi:translation elongation factor EF-G
MRSYVPVLMLAVTPKTKSDQEKLVAGFEKLTAEDPTFRVQVDRQTGQAIVGVMGELQLEIILDRLKREFGVEATLGRPQVIYKSEHQAPGTAPVLLEPLMRVEVVSPKEYAVEVMDNLSHRHGEILSREDRGGTHIVTALVLLSQMFGYSADLRERTSGRATFTMRLDRYKPIPGGLDAGDDRLSHVGWPVTPRRPLNSSAVALPEPD